MSNSLVEFREWDEVVAHNSVSEDRDMPWWNGGFVQMPLFAKYYVGNDENKFRARTFHRSTVPTQVEQRQLTLRKWVMPRYELTVVEHPPTHKLLMGDHNHSCHAHLAEAYIRAADYVMRGGTCVILRVLRTHRSMIKDDYELVQRYGDATCFWDRLPTIGGLPS